MPVSGARFYEVSNLGRVRSRRFGKMKVLRAGLSRTGYLTVSLSVARNCQVSFYVHRLVAQAFATGSGPMALHRDGNRLNNRADNLRWGTAKENAADRERHKQERLAV